MPLLNERVVLVTGSGTGIGAAIVQRAAAEGARVMVHDRDETAAREVAESVGVDTGLVLADLEDEDAPARIIEATVDRFGRIDALVNNAALTTRSNVDSVDLAHFDRMMRVNLRAPFFLIQAALPHFRKQGGGVVLNVGSVNAYSGEPDLLAYSITKGGLMTMTRNLGDALAREGIRVNQINPGWTLTPNERRLKEAHGFGADWEKRVPVAYAPSGRIFRPEEVAAHAVFWISDAAGPVSGCVYEIEQHPFIGRNPEKRLDEP